MGDKVYVTRRIPEPGLDLLRAECGRVDVYPEDGPIGRADFLTAIQGTSGVLSMLSERIDDEAMDAAGPQCKVFANFAVGFNNVDVEAATRRGVLITNTPDVLTDATADLAWALLLAVARRVVETDHIMRSGQWKGWGPLQFLGADVAGKALGIIGAGRIGTAVALRSKGFGMKVLYTDPAGRNATLEAEVGARFCKLDEVLREADFVSVHVPLTTETHHLIGRPQLALMKASAYLINNSRGPVIDEEALVEYLRAGRIAGAALDVYEDEPKMKPGLADCANTVLLPHVGSATLGARTKMATTAARNLLAGIKGELPPNCVNPQAYGDRL